MPGISHFSKEEIAERFAGAVRLADSEIVQLRRIIQTAVDFIAEHPRDEWDDTTEQVHHMLIHGMADSQRRYKT